MKKKIIMAIMLVLSAALLVAASVLGTLAFLASSTAVSNTFTVGKVGINMLESLTDKNGVDKDGAGERTTDGNSYMLQPGKTYVKDPAIFINADSVPSFLFVKVKNGIATIESGYQAPTTSDGVPTYDATTMKGQMIAKGWQLIKSNASGEELYVYVGFNDANQTNAITDMKTGDVTCKMVGSANRETYELFNDFTITTEIDENRLADFAGAKVTLTAFAIQADGFTDKDGLQDYQHAWNAIVGRFPYESGTQYAAVVNP